MKVKVAQSCQTLCKSMDSVHGILQARILVWVAFPFERIRRQCRRPWFDSRVRKICWRRDRLPIPVFLAPLVAQLIINQQYGRPGFDSWVRKIPWRREQLPTPVLWPGDFRGLYSPWIDKESNTAEWLSLHFTSN